MLSFLIIAGGIHLAALLCKWQLPGEGEQKKLFKEVGACQPYLPWN